MLEEENGACRYNPQRQLSNQLKSTIKNKEVQMNNDPNKEVKMAWARGDLVQYRFSYEWRDWNESEYINTGNAREWRVKPKVEFPPMPEGWRNSDGKLWTAIDKWSKAEPGTESGCKAKSIEDEIMQIAQDFAIKYAGFNNR